MLNINMLILTLCVWLIGTCPGGRFLTNFYSHEKYIHNAINIEQTTILRLKKR